MRACSKCKKNLPDTSYYRSSTGGYCKTCQKAYAKHYQAVKRQMNRAEAMQDAEACPTCDGGLVDPRQPSYRHCLSCYKEASPYKGRNGLAGTGVSHVTFLRMLQAQDFRCLICGTHDDERKLVADHCHTSGVYRGAICGSCNTGLGMFYDNPSAVQRAVLYLKNQIVSPPKGTSSL